MANTKKLVGTVVTEYLEKFPTTASLTLAKKIYNDNTALFKNVEHVRDIVRRYRGRQGGSSREKITDRRFLLPAKTNDNPFQLPEFKTYDYVPYFVPQNLKKGLVMADLHVPYTDKNAIELAMRDAKKFGIDFILIAGDLLDCYQLSRFQKDPREKHFKDEIDTTKKLIDSWRKTFPNVKIIIKEGNHDRRYQDYLMCKAPELIGFEEFRLDVLLGLFDKGIDYVADKRVIQCGKLSIIHGDEYWKAVSSPANPARTAFLRAKASTLMAHHHQTSDHTEPTIKGEIITCWSVGCMCDLHPPYMPLNKWNLGYALIEKESSGNFQLDNKRIWNGKLM